MKIIAIGLIVLLLPWSIIADPGSRILLARRTAVGNPLMICLPGAPNNYTQIGVQNCANEQYIGLIGIGSPPQNFTVLFDTGSNVMWIPTAGCSGNCSNRQFNPSASSTYNPGTYTLTLDYGDGSSVYGSFGSENIVFYNTGINNTPNPVLFVSQDYQDVNMQSNGLVGLGYNLSVNNPFDSAYKVGQISTWMFSVELLTSGL